MDPTSASLLERLRRPSDAEAWARFVDLYTPLIYSWACRIGLQEADASDLVQEVFVVLLQKMPEFVYDPQKSFRAWLKTITLNKWRENRRRAETRRETVGAPLPDLAGQEDSDDFWEADYRQQVVARALQLMQQDFQPTTWQACLEVVSGRPAAEVAQELGLQIGAVRSAKCRVLGRLHQELAGMLD
jgi:RNA polymerase sigma-70 factor (ECF subfamily)